MNHNYIIVGFANNGTKHYHAVDHSAGSMPYWSEFIGSSVFFSSKEDADRSLEAANYPSKNYPSICEEERIKEIKVCRIELVRLESM